MRYLGVTMDVHCGGVDLVFPHHEDEIAQSEGATGETFSRFWCHGEFLLTDGSKMAKRVGNVSTVGDMREQGVSAAAFRAFVFSTHYRKQLNLSAEALEAATEGVRRIGDFADRLAAAKGGTPELAAAAQRLEDEASEALFDDLNAPLAMGALFTFIRAANAELNRGGDDVAALEKARDSFAKINGVLDIIPEPDKVDDAAEIEALLTERRAAREARDFARSDAIRKSLEERGVEIKDGPTGTTWKKVR
jgi:cysteinyl-tRNA synthetase